MVAARLARQRESEGWSQVSVSVDCVGVCRAFNVTPQRGADSPRQGPRAFALDGSISNLLPHGCAVIQRIRGTSKRPSIDEDIGVMLRTAILGSCGADACYPVAASGPQKMFDQAALA